MSLTFLRTPSAWSVAIAFFLVAPRALAQDPPATTPAAPAAPPATSASPSPAAPAPATPNEKQDEKPKDHSVYVSLSPIHLIMPMLEVTTEVRLHEKVGLAGIAGIGSLDPNRFNDTKPPPGVTTSNFIVWELGGQFVGYPVGHFDHGMQLGAELLYAGVSGSASDGNVRAVGTAQGLAIGPFVGYKFTAPIGFSLNLQAGAQYLAMRASAQGSNNTTSSAEKAQFIPLININLGWAF